MWTTVLTEIASIFHGSKAVRSTSARRSPILVKDLDYRVNLSIRRCAIHYACEWSWLLYEANFYYGHHLGHKKGCYRGVTVIERWPNRGFFFLSSYYSEWRYGREQGDHEWPF